MDDKSIELVPLLLLREPGDSITLQHSSTSRSIGARRRQMALFLIFFEIRFHSSVSLPFFKVKRANRDLVRVSEQTAKALGIENGAPMEKRTPRCFLRNFAVETSESGRQRAHFSPFDCPLNDGLVFMHNTKFR